MSSPAPGRLCIIATPIGNLQDITLRALQRLKDADLIAAEDTRRTRQLLAHFDIHTPLTAYYKDNEMHKAEELLEAVAAGSLVALVSDAGTPGLSDPGQHLVGRARERGLAVEVVPGASALLTALAGAGLAMDAFTFHGFLENKSGPRKRQLESLKHRPELQVFYVAPHRLDEVLHDMLAVWGDRRAVAARELTKIHEEFKRAPLSHIAADLQVTPARGEYTLIVEGASGDEAAAEPVPATVEEHLEKLQQQGFSLNQAVARVARERGLPRADVYRQAHRHSRA